jgi:hypothetical protein
MIAHMPVVKKLAFLEPKPNKTFSNDLLISVDIFYDDDGDPLNGSY